MPEKCPHCGADAVEVDEEGKLEVCLECASIIREITCFRNDDFTRNPTVGESSGNVRSESYSMQDRWRSLQFFKNSHKRVYYKMDKRVREITTRLRLPKDYSVQVMEIIKNLYYPEGKKTKIQNLPKSRKVIAGSCIYIVCRRNGVVISKRNIAEATDSHISVIGRCLQVLEKYFQFGVQDPEPEELLNTILTQLEISDVSLKTLILDLYQFCQDTLLIGSKNKMLLMLGIVRICVEGSKNYTLKCAKFKEICVLHTCTAVAVTKSFGPVKKALVKFAENIPWIKKIKHNTIHKYIKEILSFYKQCGNAHDVDVKYDWQVKRDKADIERRGLISEAQKRIEACQKHSDKLVSLTDEMILHKNCQFISSQNSASTSSIQKTSSQTEPLSTEVQFPSDHVCCAHCCIEPINCPNQENGISDFCKLERHELIIEYILRKGYSEIEIMNGNPESIFCGEYYQSDSDGEREDLDDRDIPDDEIHKYVKTETDKKNAEFFSLLTQPQND